MMIELVDPVLYLPFTKENTYFQVSVFTFPKLRG